MSNNIVTFEFQDATSLSYSDIPNEKKNGDFLFLSLSTYIFSVISNGIASTASMLPSWDWPDLDASCTGHSWLHEVSEHSCRKKILSKIQGCILCHIILISQGHIAKPSRLTKSWWQGLCSDDAPAHPRDLGLKHQLQRFQTTTVWMVLKPCK